jgi:hypothetical protein
MSVTAWELDDELPSRTLIYLGLNDRSEARGFWGLVPMNYW